MNPMNPFTLKTFPTIVDSAVFAFKNRDKMDIDAVYGIWQYKNTWYK